MKTMTNDRYYRLLEQYQGKPEEIGIHLRQWSETMAEAVEKTAEDAVSAALQMGICNPAACDWDDVHMRNPRSHLDRWLHTHHAEWNATIWRICNSKPGLIEKMAQLLREDLKTTHAGEYTAYFGFDKEWVQEVLDGFLTAHPAWLGAYCPTAAKCSA